MIPKLTPTEQKIMDVLADGRHHNRKELLDVIDDPLDGTGSLGQHIHNLRKKLNPHAQSVLCVLRGYTINYQWVRLIGSSDE